MKILVLILFVFLMGCKSSNTYIKDFSNYCLADSRMKIEIHSEWNVDKINGIACVPK